MLCRPLASALVLGLLAATSSAFAQGAAPPGPPPAPPPPPSASASAPAAPSPDASTAPTPAPPPDASAAPTPAPPPPPPPGATPEGPVPTGNAAQPLPPPPAAPPGATPYPQPYPYNGAPPPGGFALPPGQPPPPGWTFETGPKKMTRRWYGWQTLIGVLASDLLLVAGAGTPVSYVGGMGHMLTGPIVHWAHGHVGQGFISLGLNVGLPLGGALVGILIYSGGSSSSSGENWDVIIGAAMGTVLGAIVAPVIDIAALSTEEVPAKEKKGAQLLLPTSIGVLPMMDKDRKGLSLVGRF